MDRAEQAWVDYEYREHPKGLYYTCFVDGYRLAEKYIVSLIQSRLNEIIGDAQPKPILRAELQELIKRIMEEE